mgnify:CR=1 FL=1
MCKHPMNNERDDNSRHEARINQYNRVISVDNRVIFHKNLYFNFETKFNNEPII